MAPVHWHNSRGFSGWRDSETGRFCPAPENQEEYEKFQSGMMLVGFATIGAGAATIGAGARYAASAVTSAVASAMTPSATAAAGATTAGATATAATGTAAATAGTATAAGATATGATTVAAAETGLAGYLGASAAASAGLVGAATLAGAVVLGNTWQGPNFRIFEADMLDGNEDDHPLSEGTCSLIEASAVIIAEYRLGGASTGGKLRYLPYRTETEAEKRLGSWPLMSGLHQSRILYRIVPGEPMKCEEVSQAGPTWGQQAIRSAVSTKFMNILASAYDPRAGALASGPSSNPDPSDVPGEPTCCVCCHFKVRVVFLPCGHACVCKSCFLKLPQMAQNGSCKLCPNWRGAVSQAAEVFL